MLHSKTLQDESKIPFIVTVFALILILTNWIQLIVGDLVRPVLMISENFPPTTLYNDSLIRHNNYCVNRNSIPNRQTLDCSNDSWRRSSLCPPRKVVTPVAHQCKLWNLSRKLCIGRVKTCPWTMLQATGVDCLRHSYKVSYCHQIQIGVFDLGARCVYRQ